MYINGRYITKQSILGYHWYVSSVFFRKYLIIDLIDGSKINILTNLGTGEEVADVSKILKFIKG